MLIYLFLYYTTYLFIYFCIILHTYSYIFVLYKCCLRASVDTEMCCPKGKCGCQYFILFNLKKKIHEHRGPGFIFNKKKLLLDYYFCLKSGPVSPLPPGI